MVLDFRRGGMVLFFACLIMRLSYYYYRLTGVVRQGAARAVLGWSPVTGHHRFLPTAATARARPLGTLFSSTGWSMIATSWQKPGVSTFHSSTGADDPTQVRNTGRLTYRRETTRPGGPDRARYHVIPVYRDRGRFPFGHISAPFELKTDGTIRAKSPRLQALEGKGRFRKSRGRFPFGQRVSSPTTASSASRSPPVNAAAVPLPDDTSRRGPPPPQSRSRRRRSCRGSSSSSPALA